MREAPFFDPAELASWSGGRWRGALPPAVKGFAIDSRAVKPGDCFVALAGSRADGHDFLADARSRGAACALIRADRGLDPQQIGLPLLEVPDTRRALTDLARGHRARLKGDFIAVTGSSGKTSVKELIADFLSRIGPTARTIGNWNNDLGVPLSLLSMAPSDRFGVFEVGMNHPGELDPLCALVCPVVSVVTCVGPVHIEFFDSEEDIAREKAAVVRALSPEGRAILPADDRWFNVLRSYARCPVTTVSMMGEADYRVESGAGNRFAITEWQTGETVALEAPLPGRHVRMNIGLAAAVARRFGVPWAEIVASVKAFRPPPMRWETVAAGGVVFVNDAYNANPLSMRAALEAFAEEGAGTRRWLVLGGMRELGRHAPHYHREVGRAIASGPWEGAVFVGEEACWMADGAREARFAGFLATAPDAESAMDLLAGRLREGDRVLLKASRALRLERAIEIWRAKTAGRANGSPGAAGS